jgi:fructose-1,6-bisphosphatase/inositol monophosphatase family enzyme
MDGSSSMMEFDLECIADVGCTTILEVQKKIQGMVIDAPARALDPVIVGSRKKPALRVDVFAEDYTEAELRKRLNRYRPRVIGEESLMREDLDLSNEDRLVVLLDMLDGTDLLERGLSNWCSAMVFYYPPEHRILASFVGIPNDAVYFAIEDRATPVRKFLWHVRRGQPRVINVTGPSSITRLHEASLSFYGQQPANFMSVAGHARFAAKMAELATIHDESLNRMRIYNLAGNPMMMKLIDGSKRIDAVFDLRGQLPHDMVPGTYIAQRAGAILCGLDGQPVVEEDLARMLLRPAHRGSKKPYLLAATEGLKQEFLAMFGTTTRTD